ncbi:NfeD family protein [Oceanobacillus halotolerans]|uniref:NfeD family protein n=1 Tax=Oceanobacillus halotolerans TaxID=2663380 RepID=UPI0013D9569E|nr:NfeD family protein [Oceanobacillus halotolerans]
MEIFTSDWVAFIITGLGTLFLLGEIVVNMRGLFAILGIGFMTVYFTVYLETSSLMLMLIIYFVGLLLIVVDGKLVNDGTLATLGIASMILAVALPAPNFFAGMYAVMGVLIGAGCSLLFLKVFKRRDMWSKMTLMDRLTKEDGYNSMNETYETLLHEKGITVSDMRPVGTIRVNNKQYSAISNGQWIPHNTQIRVVYVDGTKIQVERIEEER